MRPILALGVTLFEVLVSLLILSLVLLGLDVMEISAFQLNLKAYYASVAEQQLHNMEERLRLLGAREGQAQQLAQWNQENSHILPQGMGQVSGHFPDYRLTLCWGGKHLETSEITRGAYAGCLTEQFIL